MRTILFTILFYTTTLAIAQQPNALLDKYREMALNYNHNLKAAEKNIAASIEYQKMAKADRGAKLVANANYKYTGNPMSLSLNIPSMDNPLSFSGNSNQYGVALSLSQPIYTGGKILETIKTAKYQQSMAYNQSELLKSMVCFQTDIQYWNTVARAEMVMIAQDFKNSIDTLVKNIKEKVEVGLTDPGELLMAEVKLNDAEYQLLQARNAFETGRMALNSLIGINLNEQTEVDKTVPLVLLPDTLLSSDGKLRPEIKIAQQRINIAHSRLKLNDSKYKPQFIVGAEGNYSSPGYNFNPDMDPNYAVYAKLSIPIFEWGKRRSEKRKSKQEVGMEGDNLNQITDDVNLEIATAKTSLEQAMKRVELSAASLNKAKENEKNAMERYNEGRISIIEVIDAQVYRQNSQINFTDAKVSAQTNYSQLIKALFDY